MKTSLLTLLPGLIIWFLPPVSGQAQDVLMKFSGIQSNQAGTVALSDAGQAIVVYPELFERTRAGDEFMVQVDADELLTVVLDEAVRYVNGDTGISARGKPPHGDLRFTLTAGPSSVFGYISNTNTLWQLVASGAEGEAAGFTGELFHPRPLLNSGSGLVNDFYIPQLPPSTERSAATEADPLELPLQLAVPSTTPSTRAASNEGINENNFRLSQSFSSHAIVAGEVAAAEVTLTNISDEWHTNLFLEVFFLLEDSTLVSADSNCTEQLSASLQKVLRCELGSFAPGEQKQLRYSVRPHLDSGSTLLSTILVGAIRNDALINIVEDVFTDSDRDGISDYNERLDGTDPADADSVDYATTIIDVLALYTGGAESAFPGGVPTRINQLFSVANQIYRDSGVAINLRPVHHRRVSYSDEHDMDTALQDLISQSHPAFSEVEELRTRFGADLVALFRPLESGGGRCGLAPVGGFRTNGYFAEAAQRQTVFSTVAIDCPVDIALAHELGHNMGLTHSHLQDGYGGTFNFATGYGVRGEFVTVMAFPEAFNAPSRVPRFSNPESECLGFPCGVSADQSLGADAVQALNLVRQQIASYRRTTLPDLPLVPVASLSGNSTEATIAIAASRDSGFSFSDQFTPQDKVDLSAVITVDERHIGSPGSIHVLMGEEGTDTLFQLTPQGELLRWDSRIESLISLAGIRRLNPEERLSLLNRFSFGEDLIGIRLVIYIAYWVPDHDEIVYTRNPLTLRVVRARP